MSQKAHGEYFKMKYSLRGTRAALCNEGFIQKLDQRLKFCLDWLSIVSHMQHAKFHRIERPPFMDSQRQRITSCAQRRVTLYILWYSFLHMPFCRWSSLTAISLIRDTECRHYTVMQVFVLPWHLVLFPHLFECDRKNLQNLLKPPSGSTWPALTGMASSAAAKQLQKEVSFLFCKFFCASFMIFFLLRWFYLRKFEETLEIILKAFSSS